ncbi:enoyl-CoA hydratase/isomerase family protein [Natribacillus halophilus]|uniref:2-(1,2-epoxy-1,2-dihydrophenyl)acetyl-CoA isomerase n=1 Tax=Natribacillus halophilus TaxID=549003 RepID=A0A1G8L284_9BACI|nr:enoyl-CoA hydratase-related protein [Natribacillus halophilus]SDI49773.1 2-(1,2-epoxy-1,2-dihydrophenyl)acetyl-CoA isomerase [Natribacillus halophilus]
MEPLMIDTQEGIRTITINRPERMNAINDDISLQIEQAFADASADDDVRVVVITGKGRAFCSGLDLSEMSDAFGSRHEQLDELGWVGRQALSIVHCDKPVIAAVNGIAAGAGLSLALACDMRFMSDQTRVTTGYVRRGLSPDAGMSYFLPRLIGQAKAAQMIFTGRDIYPDEAERTGLVNEVFPDEAFHDRVMDISREITAGPPIALTFSKRLLTADADAELSALLKQEYAYIKRCFATKDVEEGIQAFLEKRKPNFQGE